MIFSFPLSGGVASELSLRFLFYQAVALLCIVSQLVECFVFEHACVGLGFLTILSNAFCTMLDLAIVLDDLEERYLIIKLDMYIYLMYLGSVYEEEENDAAFNTFNDIYYTM